MISLLVLALVISGLKLTGYLLIALVLGALLSAFVFHKNPKIESAVVTTGDTVAKEAEIAASEAKTLSSSAVSAARRL